MPLLLLAFVVVQRLLELALSRRHLARQSAAARASEGPGAWLAMVAVHVAVIVLPLAEHLGLGTRAGPGLFWSSLALFAAAQVVRYWALGTLGASWNARAVVDPARGFVARGPYRFVRHPNYVAMIAEVIAIPLALGAWRSALVLNLVHAWVLARRIRAEERQLFALPGYADAMGGKGRLWPRRASSRRAYER